MLFRSRKKQAEDPNQPEKSGASKPTYVKTYKEDIELQEKKDACYHKVKARYKVWPSAYASGALVKCRKKGAKNWGTKTEEYIYEGKPKSIDPNASYNPRTMHQALTSLGWAQATSGASGHAKYTHPNSKQTLIVPLNHPGEINRMLSRRIIKTAISEIGRAHV